MELRPHLLTAARACGIRSLIGAMRFLPIGPFQCSTPTRTIWQRQPKSCFGENQLFPDSISFSLLTTSHPNALYNIRVRASICLSTNFTLLMASSSGFGSYVSYNRAIHARFPLSSAPEGLSYARYTHSPAHSSIGMPSRMQASAPTPCKYTVSGLFHSPLGVLFTFPSRYWFTIGHRTYLALPVSSGRFTRAIHVSSYSRI